MLEQLAQWGQLLDQLEETAKRDGIVPGDYLGDYHAIMMRVFRGLEVMEHFRSEQVREMFEHARAAAEANAEQAKLELEKLDRVTRQIEAAIRRQELAHEDAEARVIKRVAEEVGKQVGEASVIRAKAYGRTQFAKSLAAAVAAALLLLGIGVPLDRVIVVQGTAASEMDAGS
jgi:hypothetical protein